VKPNYEGLHPALRRFYERLDAGASNRKPKPTPVAIVPISERVAEVVKANPETVRISARGADGVTVFEKAQLNPARVTVMVEAVQEVDAKGRPVWPSVVIDSDYDPISRL
jgi:archaeosine-15-forming tRNA-guanine transglycosylase